MPSDPLWIAAGKITPAVGTATIAASTDLFTIATHGLAVGDRVTVDTLTGGAAGVLVVDGAYYVRDVLTNTFALSTTLGGAPVLFASDGGAAVYRFNPTYTGRELRRAFSGLIYPAHTNRFGAYAGVRPHSTEPVTLSGTTWTVQDLVAVVYPAVTSQSGAYVVQHPSESGSLNAADGTNPRRDALDLQIQDTDEDASGQRRARVVYVAGTPAGSPADPSLTANSLRLCTMLVPAGGSPVPSILTYAPFTVSLGGILPIRTVADLPTTGRHAGMYVDIANSGELQRWSGSTWEPVGSLNVYNRAMNPPACRVNRTTDLAISHNVLTAVAFTAERYDTATFHDNSTNNSRITMPIAGVYEVGFTGQYASAADYTRIFSAIRKNGTTDICRDGRVYTTSGGGGPALTMHTNYKFAAADYVEVTVLQLNSAAAARNLSGSIADSGAEFWATWLGNG